MQRNFTNKNVFIVLGPGSHLLDPRQPVSDQAHLRRAPGRCLDDHPLEPVLGPVPDLSGDQQDQEVLDQTLVVLVKAILWLLDHWTLPYLI